MLAAEGKLVERGSKEGSKVDEEDSKYLEEGRMGRMIIHLGVHALRTTQEINNLGKGEVAMRPFMRGARMKQTRR